MAAIFYGEEQIPTGELRGINAAQVATEWQIGQFTQNLVPDERLRLSKGSENGSQIARRGFRFRFYSYPEHGARAGGDPK